MFANLFPHLFAAQKNLSGLTGKARCREVKRVIPVHPYTVKEMLYLAKAVGSIVVLFKAVTELLSIC